MYVLFMTLVVMKHGNSWNTIGHIFKIKVPTLLRLILGFVEKIQAFCIEHLVTKYDNKYCSETFPLP